MPKEGTIDGSPTIRKYLEENNIPYCLWAYPDKLKGLYYLVILGKMLRKEH